MASHNSAAVSPTAHYTGYIWYRNGLSHPALVTGPGRAMFAAVSPVSALSRWAGGPTLQGLLLARHRAIDFLLDQAIAEGRVSQVIEVAAGLSPRGWRFKQRHGQGVRYIEADLPDMARLKRERLARAGLLQPGHEVVAFDALATAGPLSLADLAESLDPRQGLALITEGLLMYLGRTEVQGLWTRFAHTLNRFEHGVYLSDLHLNHANRGLLMRGFRPLLETFVRGAVQWHFHTAPQALSALAEAGFAHPQLHHPRQVSSHLLMPHCAGPDLVRVIEARAGRQG